MAKNRSGARKSSSGESERTKCWPHRCRGFDNQAFYRSTVGLDWLIIKFALADRRRQAECPTWCEADCQLERL